MYKRVCDIRRFVAFASMPHAFQTTLVVWILHKKIDDFVVYFNSSSNTDSIFNVARKLSNALNVLAL